MKGLLVSELREGEFYRCGLSGLKVLVYKDSRYGLNPVWCQSYEDGQYKNSSVRDGQLLPPEEPSAVPKKEFSVFNLHNAILDCLIINKSASAGFIARWVNGKYSKTYPDTTYKDVIDTMVSKGVLKFHVVEGYPQYTLPDGPYNLPQPEPEDRTVKESGEVSEKEVKEAYESIAELVLLLRKSACGAQELAVKTGILKSVVYDFLSCLESRNLLTITENEDSGSYLYFLN